MVIQCMLCSLFIRSFVGALVYMCFLALLDEEGGGVAFSDFYKKTVA